MIDERMIPAYAGPAFERGETYLYMPPHPLLNRFISCYTLTCPQDMPAEYTILPTASSTIIFSIDDHSIKGNLRGVNTVACNVGANARRQRMLLLIEFRPGGLFPLLGIAQRELKDLSFFLDALNRRLDGEIRSALLDAAGAQTLIDKLNRIFLAVLGKAAIHPQLRMAMEAIHGGHGGVSAKELSDTAHYSEKHIRRLFIEHLGVGVKTYSRIVRVNHALHLLNSKWNRLTDVSAFAGYFDQSHFIRDFQALCGTTPQSYMQRMSLFYNDSYKM